MAFTVTPVNPSKPGDLIHFWDIAALDADTDGPWIATGFQASSGESGATIGGPLPQYTHMQAQDGTAAIYTGVYRVELNSTPQVATVPGYSYVDSQGVTRTVGATTFTAPIGGAFRLRKSNAVGSGGTVRVGVGYFPGNLTTN